MFEIADRLLARLDSGERIAVATAVSIAGSAPRTIGTSMAVTQDGTVIGSISGGCVEGAVYELCGRVLATGVPEIAKYGFSDDTAFSIGLSCGGRIEVVTTILAPDDASAATIAELRSAAAGRPAEVTTVLSGERLGAIVTDVSDCDGLRLFTESSEPPPRLIIFGAVEFSVALCNAATVLGYRVTVCDARSVFATPERFPAADEIVVEWPTEYLERTAGSTDHRTVIAILSHDDRFDIDLIEAALALPIAYVGAMGSRTTHERRLDELRRRQTVGLERLHSPIGLDLQASTPEETAISILAEVLAARSSASAISLSAQSGAIHHQRTLAT